MLIKEKNMSNTFRARLVIFVLLTYNEVEAAKSKNTLTNHHFKKKLASYRTYKNRQE